jgi:alpha/beta superfamily hydrolase
MPVTVYIKESIMFKYIVMTCLGITLAGTSFSQALHDATGNWYGFFRTPEGNKQHLQLSFEHKGAALTGQMKSPEETKEAININDIYATDDSLRFTIKAISFTYKGSWNTRNGRYEGYFEQLGNRVELNFSRREVEQTEHSQEPKPPFAYDVEEVKFVNKKDKILLTGTFTKPGIKGSFPAIIMVAGDRPQNRDGEFVDHKPFAVISDYFAKHGMAVLRFDSRGIGTSTGNADSATIDNFAEDVRAAVSFLRQRNDVDSNAIGMLSQGQGGAIAQVVASTDDKIAFLITMAAPGVTGSAEQAGDDKPFKEYLDILVNEKDTVVRRKKALASLKAIYSQLGAPFKDAPDYVLDLNYKSYTQADVLSFLAYDPAVYLPKIKCPVLAMNGEKDLEVNAGVNLKGIEAGLIKGGNQTVTLRTFPGLNHLFQHCNSCTIAEYGSLDETINPAVLEFMVRWIQLLY